MLPKGLKTFTFNVSGLESFATSRSEHLLKDFLPPGLTELYLDLPFGFSELAPRCLPSTLTKFGFPEIEVPHTKPFLAHLPRGLLCLDGTLRVYDLSEADWALAPPQLHTIACILTGQDTATVGWAWLPRSLTKCQANGYSWNSLQINTMPTGMTELTIVDVDTDELDERGMSFVGTLPKSLEVLSLLRIMDLMDCMPEAINGDKEPHEIASIIRPLWPSTLTSLAITTNDIFTSHFDLMPTTLQSLVVDCQPIDMEEALSECEPVTICFKLLPPILTELNLSFHSRARQEITFLDAPPKSLKSLTVRGGLLDIDFFHRLPSTLTYLNAMLMGDEMATAPQVQSNYSFPSSLTHLELRYWHSEILTLIPQSVTRLGIHKLMLIDPATINVGNYLNLPKGLQSFVATIRHLELDTTDLPYHSFADLHHLKTLLLTEVSMSSKCLETLPRGLEELTVQLDPFLIEDAKFIPPKLSAFDPSLEITDDIISELSAHWPLLTVEVPDELVDSVNERITKLRTRSS